VLYFIHMKNISNKLSLAVKVWLVLAIAITMVAGLFYAVVQQTYRTGANDPQIAIVKDVIEALENGIDPQAIAQSAPLDISATLDPFITIYSSTGTPVSSTGQLKGNTPSLPSGVFSYVNSKGQDRLTWQPDPGVRIAAVVDKYGGPQPGYVLVGRSLVEVEKREKALLIMVAIGWAATLILTLIAALFLLKMPEHHHKEEEIA